ncbi:hypothetical protein GW17_00021454 [Ensete ventricosum]|uniref:Uncharacterized protein n=1 Tax=Ensete ventricosum TaxID=4639 RepID=A0A444EWR0_ENSVE|nr:hypothetical protein GW17_00021454 [Ensete ventricosum]RZR70621.1 hypothetical protein BHM03_00000867 [Ensete ventricosum]
MGQKTKYMAQDGSRELVGPLPCSGMGHPSPDGSSFGSSHLELVCRTQGGLEAPGKELVEALITVSTMAWNASGEMSGCPTPLPRGESPGSLNSLRYPLRVWDGAFPS